MVNGSERSSPTRPPDTFIAPSRTYDGTQDLDVLDEERETPAAHRPVIVG
jgi:hypothetical protein